MLKAPLLRSFLRFYRPGPSPSVRATSKRPPPPPPEQRGPSDHDYLPSSSRTARKLVIAFGAMSLPITILLQFPNRTLPPVRDPPELRPFSRTPLTDLFPSHPLVATKLAAFRLRRGEYHQSLLTHWSYTPYNFVSARETTRWHTAVTHMFAHGSAVHWGMCMIAFASLADGLVHRYNARTFSVLFVGSGIASVFVQNAFFSEDSPKARASHIGSSGALMALMTIVALEMPQVKWQLMFIPYGIPGRVLLGALVAWDAAGVLGYEVVGGISHGGHLAGDLVGALVWFLWLRRGKMIGRRGV